MLDGLARLGGDFPAVDSQAAGFTCGVGSQRNVAGHFLRGCGHLVDGRGHLLGFLMLLHQAVGTVLSQRVGLLGLTLQLHGGVLQACEAGLQVGLLAEHGHFQLRFDAAAIGVHARDQRITGALLRQLHQPAQATLLPMQAGKAERNRQQGRCHEARGMVEECTEQKADLAHQNKRQPLHQYG